MAKLLVRSKGNSTFLTKLGGMPLTPQDFVWPICRTCEGPMTFYSQIALPETGIPTFLETPKLLSLFKCDNNPGLCDDTFPETGGNAAYVFDLNNCRRKSPKIEAISFPEVTIDIIEYEEPKDFDFDQYWELMQQVEQEIMGKVGGRPVFVAGQEMTMHCDCGYAMQFVVQLAESRLTETPFPDMNFGNGRAFAFVCPHCFLAKWMWQC